MYLCEGVSKARTDWQFFIRILLETVRGEQYCFHDGDIPQWFYNSKTWPTTTIFFGAKVGGVRVLCIQSVYEIRD